MKMLQDLKEGGIGSCEFPLCFIINTEVFTFILNSSYNFIQSCIQNTYHALLYIINEVKFTRKYQEAGMEMSQ